MPPFAALFTIFPFAANTMGPNSRAIRIEPNTLVLNIASA